MMIYAHLVEDPSPDFSEAALPDSNGLEISPATPDELQGLARDYAAETAASVISADPDLDWDGWAVSVEDSNGQELYRQSVAAYMVDPR